MALNSHLHRSKLAIPMGIAGLLMAGCENPMRPLLDAAAGPQYSTTVNGTQTLPVRNNATIYGDQLGISINDRGFYVATQQFADNSLHQTLWTPTANRTLLGTPGGAPGTGQVFDISESNQVVGSWSAAAGGGGPTIWEPGLGMRQLPTLSPSSATSVATGINDVGFAVGSSLQTVTYTSHAVIWNLGANTITDIAPPGTDNYNSQALAINNAGQIVGGSWYGSARRAVIWAADLTPTTLGTLGGNFSDGTAINSAGWVVGQSQNGSGQYRAFVWRNGTEGMIELPMGAGTGQSIALGINDIGDIVGQIDSHPVVWEHCPTAANCTRAVTFIGGMDVYGYASKINNHGQAAGLIQGGASTPVIWNLTINNAPNALFNAPASAMEGANVHFTDASTDAEGNALTDAWDFGDGATSTARNPVHAFELDGSYTVTLIVTDTHGAADTITSGITINNRPPHPTLVLDATSISAGSNAGVTVGFTDAGADDTATTEIHWGDGSGPQSFGTMAQGTTQHHQHLYTTPGTYKIRFYVTDHGGSTQAITVTLTVT